MKNDFVDVLAYCWFLLLALWGGTATYVSNMHKKSAPFSIAGLVGEWCISGFAGVITALLCDQWHLPFALTAAAAGISGHMGGRAIHMMEDWAESKIKSVLSKLK